MNTVFKVVHIAACVAAIAAIWRFLGGFYGHFDDGIWDSSAITAVSVLIVCLIAVALSLTFFLVKITDDPKRKP